MIGTVKTFDIFNTLYTVEITEFFPGEPAFKSGHPDGWEPEDPADWDFKIIDVKVPEMEWFDFDTYDEDFNVHEHVGEYVDDYIESLL